VLWVFREVHPSPFQYRSHSENLYELSSTESRGASGKSFRISLCPIDLSTDGPAELGRVVFALRYASFVVSALRIFDNQMFAPTGAADVPCIDIRRQVDDPFTPMADSNGEP
ncbi:MAG: hypothetical protein ABI442_10285, partial [Gemmatimonadaceae bacterium]